ncbi:UDP-N-acetylglucosamine--N-acetylmuramyl-(pentapeptide) pyrophosphoryl-undecaprenol N-acetylglucosamine transferase [Poriferisphaera sp. WC338]|uniref:UDP-N-acetylglucosamine--N-acetylmuramyl- (pentapeptide) pyrophosphoryl-undecaprenol N-acetylglucosamine transferase n=1 Tax=Poriferisphaera sp. WC338 TaxID=3425129 RepID=UPI003D813014
MSTRTIIFAGGGSGGHIFPNLAIFEKLRELRPDSVAHFLLSKREIDADIASKNDLSYAALPASPLRMRPRDLLDFYRNYKASEAQVTALIKGIQPRAMVATGGFVSAPAVKAARKLGLPVALVNLDAVPGKANKFTAKDATEIFSVYQTGDLPRARQIGLPLRASAKAQLPQALAREQLHLDPDMKTLLVFAGSQGGRTLNEMMIEFASRTNTRNLLGQKNIPTTQAHHNAEPRNWNRIENDQNEASSGWQVLHLTGPDDRDRVAEAYAQAGIPARVESFCNQMHLCWAAATLGICRAGAGSVAEVWTNHVPTIFLPYPFHKDNHQFANVEPLVATGGAMVLKDQADAIANASQLVGAIKSLMTNAAQRERMRNCLADTQPDDGAATVAQWILTV